jgi:hypothetical protein
MKYMFVFIERHLVNIIKVTCVSPDPCSENNSYIFFEDGTKITVKLTVSEILEKFRCL